MYTYARNMSKNLVQLALKTHFSTRLFQNPKQTRFRVVPHPSVTIGFPYFFFGFQLTVKNQSQRTFGTVFPSFGYVSLATSRCCCCYYLKKVSCRVFKESKCSKCNQRFCEKENYYWPKKVVKCQITDDLAKSFVIFV